MNMMYKVAVNYMYRMYKVAVYAHVHVDNV